MGLAASLRDHYAGHRVDEASGLVYMNARWYEPGSGRFVSVDPLLRTGAQQSHNAYSYVENNPVVLNDPTGMCAPHGEGCGGGSASARGSLLFATTTVWTPVTIHESKTTVKFSLGGETSSIEWVTYRLAGPKGPIIGGSGVLDAGVGGRGDVKSQSMVANAAAAHDAGGGNWLQRAARWLGDLMHRDVGEIAGAVFGAPIGVLAGLWGIGAGILEFHLRTFGIGVFDLAAPAMMARSGSTSGLRWPGPSGGGNPFWGMRLPFTGTKLDFASRWHDGFSFGQMASNPGIQVGWITRAWSGSEGGTELGPYGQAYRLYGTVGFGAIAGLQVVGLGVVRAF